MNRIHPNRVHLAAALLAATTAYGTAVAAREQIPDEPFGIRIPGRVPVHLAAGLGSGISVPWPMAVLGVAAAVRSDTGQRWPRLVVRWLGGTVLIGTLGEPATWGRHPRSRRAKATVPLHLASAAALLWAGAGNR